MPDNVQKKSYFDSKIRGLYLLSDHHIKIINYHRTYRWLRPGINAEVRAHERTKKQPDKGQRGKNLANCLLSSVRFILDQRAFGENQYLVWPESPTFRECGEFLMLFGACILLIIAALKRETTEKTI